MIKKHRNVFCDEISNKVMGNDRLQICYKKVKINESSDFGTNQSQGYTKWLSKQNDV